MDTNHIESKMAETLAPKIDQELAKKKAESEKPKPLTRQQRRFQERIKEEVTDNYNEMSSRFLNFFTVAEDPEGKEVVDLMDQLSRQWRLYCDRRKLKTEFYVLLDDYMKSLLKEYLSMKTPKSDVSEMP